MKDVANAVGSDERALPREPHVRLAPAGPAEACGRMQHWYRALADYDALLTLDPGQATILVDRAFVLGQLGRFEEAIDDLTRATRLAPDEPFLYECRAAACIRLGRLAQVDEDLRTLERIQARNVRERLE